MAATVACQPSSCCTTVQTVNVPGVEGVAGTPGTNGVSSFTFTSASFVIPAVNSTVTASVLSSVWIAIGELLFVGDGSNMGTFQVTAIPSSTQVTLKFLGYPLDSAPAATITLGATVTPTGQKFTPAAPQTVYGSGTVYEMTASAAQLAVGTNPPTLTLASTGQWLIYGFANVKLLSVTWAAVHTWDLHIRRTNNTATDLTPAQSMVTPICTTLTSELNAVQLPPISYAGTAGDTLELWGSLSALPDNTAAGVHAVQVTQTALVAVRLF